MVAVSTQILKAPRSEGNGEVSVLIPAYNAESFIRRTLLFASGQTATNIRIIVSVDLSDDQTQGICSQLAETDPRITVLGSAKRLGWGGNVNRLIEAVDTEFFFIYFHDDIIAPQYVDVLRGRLIDAPEAASAHCSVETFGNRFRTNHAEDYAGSIPERLVQLWAPKHRGMPLRSMIRTDSVDKKFRLPDDPDGITHQEAFLARLVAAGPALGLKENLYLHWLRDEGLTGGWRRRGYDAHLEGMQNCCRDVLRFLDEILPSEDPDRGAVEFAYMTRALWLLSQQAKSAGEPLPKPTDLWTAAPRLDDVEAISSMPDWLRHEVETRASALAKNLTQERV